jgi:hypothetical protein
MFARINYKENKKNQLMEIQVIIWPSSFTEKICSINSFLVNFFQGVQTQAIDNRFKHLYFPLCWSVQELIVSVHFLS